MVLMFVLAIAIAVMTATTIIPTTTAPLSFTMVLLPSMMRFRHSALRCWSIGWHTLPEEVVADIIREEVGECCVPLWSRHDIILCATKVCLQNENDKCSALPLLVQQSTISIRALFFDGKRANVSPVPLHLVQQYQNQAIYITNGSHARTYE